MTPAEVAAALAATKMQDRIALSFAGNEPDRIDEDDEWWTTPRSIAEQAMEAALADPLWRVWRVAEAAREVDAGWHSIEDGANVRMRYASDLPSRLVALREALADLDANVEEMK